MSCRSKLARLCIPSIVGILLTVVNCSKEDDPTKPKPLLDETPPAAVSDLMAISPTEISMTLKWTAPGDDGDTGTAAQYDIRYSISMINGASWDSASQVSSEPSPKAAGSLETFMVTGLSPGTTYYFAVKTADEKSNWSEMSNIASWATQTPADTIPPAAVTDLAVVDSTKNSVTLQWTAPGDDGDSGTAGLYDVRCSTSPINAGNWASALPTSGEPSPKAAGNAETFVVGGLSVDTDYYFALKTADEEFNWSALSNTVSAGTTPCMDCWSPLGSGISGSGAYDPYVRALTVYDGRLIAGGVFTAAGGVPANEIAAWNGSSWSALGPGIDYGVVALTVYNGRLIATAGGGSSSAMSAWNGTSWSPLGPGLNNSVHAFTVYDGRLIAGGGFTRIGGIYANGIAAWNGGSWSTLGSGVSGGYRFVLALTVYDGQVIAGGWFTFAGGVSARYIAAWNGSAWSPLGSGMTASTDTGVYTLTVYDGRLIAGGIFTTAGGVTANYIAAWDGSAWSPLGSGMNGGVAALTVHNGRLIAGGAFTAAGGVPARKVAAWNGSSWSALGPGFDDIVFTLTVYNGRLIAGGRFTASGILPFNQIAAWDH